jgi:hypothetical protein
VLTEHPDGDEGAPARIVQMLMLLQLAVMAFFGIKWLPRSLGPALLVLALQVGAAMLPIMTIIVLES